MLGVQFIRETATDFAHNNVIAVLNPAGEIVHRQNGVSVGVEETIEVIQKLVSTD